MSVICLVIPCRLTRICAAWAVAAAAGLLAFAGSSACAFESHFLQRSFGPDGTPGTHFEDPKSVAVDQSTGSVLMGDAEEVAVQRFNLLSEPEPFSGVLGGKLSGFGFLPPDQVAVNSADGDVYFRIGESLRAFKSSGEPAPFTAGPGAGTNEIAGSEICGVAVDPNGDIYMSERLAGVRVFTSTGELLNEFSASPVCNIAIDASGVVYLNGAENPEFSEDFGPVQKFIPSQFPVTSSTTYESAGIVDANRSFAIGVDPVSHHLYVDEGKEVVEYDEAGTRLGSFGGLPNTESHGAGVAVNGGSGQVYVAQGNLKGQVYIFGPAVLLPDVTTGAATEVKPKGTALLNGVVNPDGQLVTGCVFEYGETTAYGHAAGCNPNPGSGTSPVAVSAEVSGLAPGVEYHFRLVASNANGAHSGEDATLTTQPKPSIDAVAVANHTASSVELKATVNPKGLEANCLIDYGSTASYGSSVPCEPATFNGTSAVDIEGHVEGLDPNVTYHWRVVVSSEAGAAIGIDHTFIYDTSGEGLPDNRAYEMVTPPQKNGALIGVALFGVKVDVAESGSRVILPSIQCFGDSLSCEAKRGRTGTAYLFSRTSAGWVAHALTPPASQFQAASGWLVSAEEGAELLSMPTSPLFQDDFYVRKGDGSLVDIGPATPPEDGKVGLPWEPNELKATSDFSHVVFQEPRFWAFDGTRGETLLEFSGAGNPAPALVGVSGGPGSNDLISACQTTLGGPVINGAYMNELSADGETVYFTADACSSGTGTNEGVEVPATALYARIGGARTVKISDRSPDACTTLACRNSALSSAVFAGASEDGSKAFFTSEQQLTDSASTSGNLYEYDFDDATGENLIDVSSGDTSGGGPRVQGVVAISSDGSHVYFVAGGVLATNANQQAETAQNGAYNLYVFEREGQGSGRVTFITRLPASDGELWEKNGRDGVANVSPDGRFLVFESHGLLTADDERAGGGVQIFRYNAQAGSLVRVSVGERGFNDNGNAGIGDPRIVPSFLGWTHAGASRGDPSMSNDGSFVFFESPVGLTAHALNDVQVSAFGGEPVYAENVYEWHAGQVHLISDGRDTHTFGPTSTSTVHLIRSDGSGRNVFFTSADQLVPGDTDTQLDFYDARVCTASEPCVSRPQPPLPPCLGEACHGIPAETPSVQVGPTATFNGVGNVTVERKAKKQAKARKRSCGRHRRSAGGGCRRRRRGSHGARLSTPGKKGGR